MKRIDTFAHDIYTYRSDHPRLPYGYYYGRSGSGRTTVDGFRDLDDARRTLANVLSREGLRTEAAVVRASIKSL